MTEFTERYKQLSNKELLAILADASSYQPIAVETAKQELDSRKLSEAQLALIETQVARKKQQKEVQLQKRKEENETLKKDFFSLFATVNPFEQHLELYEKQIRYICWFFAIIAIYTLITNYSLVGWYLEDLFKGEIGVDLVIYFVDILAIVLGTILFWKRKTLGWILVAFYITTGLTGFIISLIYTIKHPSYIYTGSLMESSITAGVIGTYIIGFIFFGTNLYVLLKEKVKSVFKVDSTIAIITIVLAVAIQGALWIMLFID